MLNYFVQATSPKQGLLQGFRLLFLHPNKSLLLICSHLYNVWLKEHFSTLCDNASLDAPQFHRRGLSRSYCIWYALGFNWFSHNGILRQLVGKCRLGFPRGYCSVYFFRVLFCNNKYRESNLRSGTLLLYVLCCK